MAIGNDDFPGCAAHDRSAVGSRWSDRRRKLPDLREKVLLPTSKQGDIVIMDNFGSNKGKNPAGAEILTDLNPIEQVFAKLKHLPRKASAPIRRRSLDCNRSVALSLHPNAMRQRLRKRRIMPHLKFIPL